MLLQKMQNNTVKSDLTLSLQLSDLLLFVRVCELGNLSAVARERDVAVSQVSRAIARMEAQLGVRLMHRSTHGLSVTADGQVLLRHAQALLRQADDLAAEFDSRSHQVSGTVRVGTSPAMGVFLLPSLQTLLAKHPNLVVDIAADDAVVDMAREGLDIAIRVGTHGSDSLVARRLGEFQRRLYATPAYLLAKGRPSAVADLPKHCLVTNTATASLNRWCFKHHPDDSPDAQPHVFRPAGGLRTSDSAVQLAMVLSGLGIGRLNATIAAPWVNRGDLMEVLAEWVSEQPIPIYAVMLPERHRVPKIRACIEHWVEWYRQSALAPGTVAEPSF